MLRSRYLVTGGSGFIGSALVRALIAKGCFVRTFDNESRGNALRLRDISDQLEFVRGDIRDAAAVDAAVAGMDCVCHLACINGTEFFYSQPETVLDVAVRGMIQVLDACLRNGVIEMVLASSSEVYQNAATVPTDESAALVIPDPLNPRYSYAGGKIISELMAIHYGRKHFQRSIIIRPHNVFGPDMGWEHVIPQMALRMHRLSSAHPNGSLAFPIRGDGSATRSFIFIDDFIDGAMRIIEDGKHLNIYHVGSAIEVSVADLARAIGECFGREIRLVAGEPVPGEPRRRCPDIRKAQSLGFVPKTDFQVALKRTVQWYVEHADDAPEHVAGTDLRNVM